MDNLTVADYRLALDNLFNDPARLSLFQQCAAHTIYGAELKSIRSQLPLVLSGNRPLSLDLGFADDNHDGVGSALLTLAEAILEHPFVSPALKSSAHKIKSEFIPSRSVLRAPYKSEAAMAQDKRPKLAALESELKAIPTPDQRSVYDWTAEFLDAGDKIGQLLGERATQEAEEANPELTRIRVNVWSLVTKARRTVAEEVKRNKALPRNAEAIIFGYFDTLAAFRSKAKKDEAPPDAPAVPGADGG